MYENVRTAVEMPREEAAFRIGIGTKTLYRYEKTEQVPPDVVCRMVDVYKNSEIAAWHCASRCPLGMKFGCLISAEIRLDKKIALRRAG